MTNHWRRRDGQKGKKTSRQKSGSRKMIVAEEGAGGGGGGVLQRRWGLRMGEGRERRWGRGWGGKEGACPAWIAVRIR